MKLNSLCGRPGEINFKHDANKYDICNFKRSSRYLSLGQGYRAHGPYILVLAAELIFKGFWSVDCCGSKSNETLGLSCYAAWILSVVLVLVVNYSGLKQLKYNITDADGFNIIFIFKYFHLIDNKNKHTKP